MTTRPLVIIALALTALFSSMRTVCAQSPDVTPEQELLVTLRRLYPATAFTRVRSTPVRVLYEVVLGKSVAYAAEDGRYWFFFLEPGSRVGWWFLLPEHLFVIAAGVLLCYWLAWHLTSPVRRLHKAVESFGIRAHFGSIHPCGPPKTIY